MQIRIDTTADLAAAAREFDAHIGQRRIFAFYGKMGAGKTTFIAALCRLWGVREDITSPTFSLVNEYYAQTTGRTVYHFDFYRINKLEEVYDMGYEDYFYGPGLCLLEWPELVEGLLPDDTVRVTITVDAAGRRLLRFDE